MKTKQNREEGLLRDIEKMPSDAPYTRMITGADGITRTKYKYLGFGVYMFPIADGWEYRFANKVITKTEADKIINEGLK